MTEPLILDWDADKAEGFGAKTLGFRHRLHERPMFADEGLIEVLDRYPRDKLGVFTMGDDPVAWKSWRRGTADGLTGAEHPMNLMHRHRRRLARRTGKVTDSARAPHEVPRIIIQNHLDHQVTGIQLLLDNPLFAVSILNNLFDRNYDFSEEIL